MRTEEKDPGLQRKVEERRRSMKYLSYITNLFKASEPARYEEIALHISRLNVLLQAYQQIKTMTVAEWQATEREIEMELQWFDIHRLKLTSASYPILPGHVHSAKVNSLALPEQMNQLEKRPV
jgi:hypothetical protein